MTRQDNDEDGEERPSCQEGRKALPQHPERRFLAPSLGPTKQPASYADAFLTYLGGRLLFGQRMSFEDAVWTLKEAMNEYDIALESEEGIYTVGKFVTDARMEMYGAFDYLLFVRGAVKISLQTTPERT